MVLIGRATLIVIWMSIIRRLLKGSVFLKPSGYYRKYGGRGEITLTEVFNKEVKFLGIKFDSQLIFANLQQKNQ